jgi:predicted enzyme related to lactoylglutathione lyase
VGRAELAYVVLDTVDPERLVPFWAALLGLEVTARVADGQYVVLGTPAPKAGAPALAFQRVPEGKSVKNRMHLDLAVDDLEVATERILSMGGSWDGQTQQLGDYRWRCMADPEGNEFDIVPEDSA